MNTQAFIRPECTRYLLQPGDATRYEFSIIDFVGAKGKVWTRDGDERPADYSDVMSGVDADFVTVVIHSPIGSATSFELDLSRSFDKYALLYHKGHHPNVDRYTLCAIILAVKSLCDNDDIDRACEEMLRTPHLLAEWDNE